MTSVGRWLGIDFSGNQAMWGAGCSVSNVWIAEVRAEHGALRLASLRRVQELSGAAHPFERLRKLLAAGAFDAAAIDAPFSVPAQRVPQGDHEALLRSVGGWDRADGPFPSAAILVRELAPESGPRGAKEHRITEKAWKVNVRSTMWSGPRGGAAMTAACLTLLGLARRPMWPWASADTSGIVAEAFPAAQLKTWNLPHQRYNGNDPVAAANRRKILKAVSMRCAWPANLHGLMLASADALDALLCGLAAFSVSAREVSEEGASDKKAEGRIAVHR
jgi:predicted nuclease with RNAse H fold